MHDLIYANWQGENVGSFTDARLKAMAQALQLDMNAFNTCFGANTYADQIQADYLAGKDKGVPPTPGIFLNGTKVVSSQGENYIPSVDDLSQAIDTALGNG